MGRTLQNPWLHRFAVCTALATLGLMAVGGLVTSHGAGLAVPDWPTTNGYNMFFFPFSQWVGGIFYEHSHRLAASFVGLLTTVLAVWTWLVEPRRWLRWLAVAAFGAVVLQGVLGGLRVTMLKDHLGVFHATLAQLFFATTALIAIFTSRRWLSFDEARAGQISTASRGLLFVGIALVFAQLVLGATMRHQHAGLAVPDFPLAHGKIWPPMDEASILHMNQRRADSRDFKPITAFHVALHMTHRVGAVLALVAVAAWAWRLRRELGPRNSVARGSIVWLALLLGQAGLGAATVLSNKAADIATAHVVGGAMSLALGAALGAVVLRLRRMPVAESYRPVHEPSPARLADDGTVPTPRFSR